MNPAARIGVVPQGMGPAGGAARRREARRATILAAGLLAFLVGFLGLASGIGLVGSSARWGIVLVVLSMATWLALAYMVRRSSPVRTLRWAHLPPENPADPVGGLVVLLRRARRGRPYSQLLVAQRMRDALLEKARVTRGLGYERLNELRRDPGALGGFLGDPDLARFVLEVDSATTELGDEPPALLNPSGEEFVARMVSILGRMEAWH